MPVHAIHALLNVEDMPASLGFYSHLGFQIVESFEPDGQPEWVHLRSEQASLMLNKNDQASSPDRRRRANYSDAVFYCSVASADEMHQKLKTLGIDVGPVERQYYGLDEFITRDPDGYCIAITSEIPKSDV